ncbi:hypothetical protein BC829DRAFT_493841 [Chytridium lagenaria]|nr:hypothetical protein BC829DRAFT_493841 [Chytridium lagenaria]
MIGDAEFLWYSWDKVYQREVNNFEEHGDIGEIWFGEDSVEKMMDWASLGYTSLVGVDYSSHSVDLAIKVADEQQRSNNIGTLDAISLAANSAETKEKYSKSVAGMLEDSGILLITSCNWVEEELTDILMNDFTAFGRVKYPTFKFGGWKAKRSLLWHSERNDDGACERRFFSFLLQTMAG